MIAFILTMPSRASWNGKWSQEDELYCIVKTNRTVPKEVIGREFYYNFGDGWTACVEATPVLHGLFEMKTARYYHITTRELQKSEARPLRA